MGGCVVLNSFKTIILSIFILGIFVNIDLYHQTKDILYLILWSVSCVAMLIVLLEDINKKG